MKNVKLLTPNRTLIVDGARIESGGEETVSNEIARRIKKIKGIDVQITNIPRRTKVTAERGTDHDSPPAPASAWATNKEE